MKDFHLLIWLTQFGLSVAVPLAGFPLLALWLQNRFGWGDWVIWAAVLLGVIAAIDGFRASIKAMKRMTDSKKEPPSPAFNEHQ